MNQNAVRAKHPDAVCIHRNIRGKSDGQNAVTVERFEVFASSEPNAKRIGLGLTEFDAWIVAAAAIRAESHF